MEQLLEDGRNLGQILILARPNSMIDDFLAGTLCPSFDAAIGYDGV